MITIRRNYWVIWEDDGSEDGAGPPLDYEYNSLAEAERFCGVFNKADAPRRFFTVGHQKDIEIEELTCGDCGAKEGTLHREGCDMERCTICGEQLITCNCSLDDYSKIDYRRVPYIEYPNICAKCGKLWPNMFMVPNEEWKHYIEPEMRDKMLCMDCYATIKYLIDTGKEKRCLK
jgi:hypothetical protein